jgi:hypothetical protein
MRAILVAVALAGVTALGSMDTAQAQWSPGPGWCVGPYGWYWCGARRGGWGAWGYGGGWGYRAWSRGPQGPGLSKRPVMTGHTGHHPGH